MKPKTAKTMISKKPLDHGAAQRVADKISTANKQNRKPLGPVLHRLIRDMSNEAYHGAQGVWSSTQLKDIIDDEEVFIQKYIKKEVAKLEGEALDTGTYLHTGILEPHKLSKEIAVYPGKARFGKEWLAFKAKHKGKTIITSKQKETGDGMIKAVQASPTSMEYLEGEAEVSLFVSLLVANGKIYAPHFKKVLERHGWEDADKIPSKGFALTVKVRADCLGETFISDLKSTSGRANKKDSVRGAISKYKYDLSASLYLDIFSLIREEVSSFIWIFASKENPVAAAWVATEKQVMVGRAKWTRAVKRLADLSAANWQLVDYLREADPLPHEHEWLEESTMDLL